MAAPKETLHVLVCGGGNGAHVMAGLAASRDNTEVRVMSLFQDEAERWTELMKKNDFVVSITNSDNSVIDVKAKPNIVTKDPAIAVPGADVIIFSVPAFAHQAYFEALIPYIKKDSLIVGLPGQTGFEFQCVDILKEKGDSCAIVSFESLPWACRVLEFGKVVQVLGVKETLTGSIIQRECRVTVPIMQTMQYLIGQFPLLIEANNYIEVNLSAKSIVHPPMMYAKWADYKGETFDEKPLFYQGMDDRAEAMLSGVSDEILATGREIEKKNPDVSMKGLIHIFDWYKIFYRDNITDKSSLKMAMRTNKAYNGLVHPMKSLPNGKFVPDFTYRYMEEDVPFGMVVFKGIAQIVGVKTPIMDEVIHWCQDIMGKQYLVGSELKGKDVGSTRAPQRYGFHTLDDLLKL